MKKFNLLFLLFGLLLLPLGLMAQEGSPTPSENEKRAFSVRMPNWTIKPEIQKLEVSLDKYNSLIQALGKANVSLKKDLDEYLKKPNELLASKIERKMAVYAGNIVKDFNGIIASQDAMLANFNSLKRKLSKYHSYLSFKEKLLKEKLVDIAKEKKKMEQELKKLAIKIKSLPKDSPERKNLKRIFSRYYYRYRLQNRYYTGYNRNYQNYSILTKNLKILNSVFGSLEGKFSDLISNMEMEKKFLIENIRLQVDNMLVKKLIREGITTGKHAIKNVTAKMSQIYLKVDGFTKIHDRINKGLSSFSTSQQVLLEAGKEIDQVGMGAKGSVMDLDKIIDKFAKKAEDGEDEGENNEKNK